MYIIYIILYIYITPFVFHGVHPPNGPECRLCPEVLLEGRFSRCDLVGLASRRASRGHDGPGS